jgi:hypothetical protein
VRGLRIIFLALLSIFTLLLVRSTRAAVPVRATVGFRVAGIVVSSRDGAPVPFCRLRVARVDGREGTPRVQDRDRFQGLGLPQRGTPGGRFGGQFRGQARQPDDVVLADSHGHFSLEVAGAGDWRLTGIARGFRLQAFEEHDGFSAGIVLTEAQPVSDVVFRLQPNAQITGLVLDEAGEGVRKAQVRVEAAGDAAFSNAGERPNFSQTDDRGHFEVAGLAPGAYKVAVQARPWYASGGRFGGQSQGSSPDPSLDVVYPLTWFPGTDDETAAQVIQLGPGEDRQADLTVQPMPAIHLAIAQTASAAAEGASSRRIQMVPIVTRVSGGAASEQPGPIQTGSNGSWDVGGLTPGIYQIRLPGADGRYGSDVRQLLVKPGAGTVDLSAAQLLLHVMVTFTGAAANDAGRVVFVNRATGERIASGKERGFGRRGDDELSDDQNVRTVLLAAGSYEVHLAGGTAYLTGILAKDAKVSGSTVQLKEGSPALTLETADGRAEVSGLAQLDGKPALAAMVLLVPATLGQPGDASVVARAETNTDGSFSLTGVVPGPYILLALDRGWSVNWHDPATLARYLVHGVPVDVKPASHESITLQTELP